MKKAIVDASSFIILHKAGLLPILVEIYGVILASSVYREITANAYSGAEECERLVKEGIIEVESVASETVPGPQKLDRGEAETIQLYSTGHGDFVITDDRAAAKYCKRENITFINALLFPVVLKFSGAKNIEFCNKAFEDILEIGRYSEEVVDFAYRCDKKEISFALQGKES